VVGDSASIYKNFDHTLQANPTLFIHSATDPDVNNTQWVSFAHNGTSGEIATGVGDLYFAPISGLTVASGYYFCYSGYLTNTGSGYYIGGILSPTNGFFDGNLDTAANTLRVGVNDASRIILITDYNDRTSIATIAAQANPTLIIQSANAPAAQPTENIRFTHNQTNGVISTGKGDLILDPITEITEVCGVGLKTKEYNLTLNNGAKVNLPAGTGWGTFMIGDNQEYARIRWTAAAVVTLDEGTANVAIADTPAFFCLYDDVATVAIKNNLGVNLTLRYVIHYS
jgi:hypothetical protein